MRSCMGSLHSQPSFFKTFSKEEDNKLLFPCHNFTQSVKMFQEEKPIEKFEEDMLGRASFSENFSTAILEWKGQNSLVLALNGKWGSGKSSVINLVKEKLESSSEKSKPTIIEFNPWFFSGEEKLNEHFFTEISKELKIKNSNDGDIKIANNLRKYSSLINIIPSQPELSDFFQKILVIIGLLGISSEYLLSRFNFIEGISSIILFVVSVILIILSLIKSFIDKLADYYERKSKSSEKTVISFKEEIRQILSKRKNKILIIIDDIDRLTAEEIRILFKIIKINSDFPNVIYLLSFDRAVITKALQIQPGINGQDYLEKIVQVAFDIPSVSQEKISNIFREYCNNVLEKLPKSSDDLFNEIYWNSIYNVGLKKMFRNIRDVKRFVSSLEFNLSFLYKGESMEVNPIDFIAIESIRIFAPDFYSFMSSNKTLFTNHQSDVNQDIKDSRKKQIEDSFAKIPDETIRKNVSEIIYRLFPQVHKLFYSAHFGHLSVFTPHEAAMELRLCSPKYFDTYFTLLPAGSESELTQYELDLILNSLSNYQSFETEFKTLLKEKKYISLLDHLENYTSNTTKIPDENVPNFIQVFFDTSDTFPDENKGIEQLFPYFQCDRIITKLLGRTENYLNNLSILRTAIVKSKGLYGPVEYIELLSTKRNLYDAYPVVTKEMIPPLQQECLNKIREFADKNLLLKNKHFGVILFRWKKWDETGSITFFNKTIQTDDGLIEVLKSFTLTMSIHSSKKTTRRDYIDYKSLDLFTPSEDIKRRLENIRVNDLQTYLNNQPLIDLFIDYFGIDPRQI
jgi:predicted KAP-like P-loop ATPase